MTKLVWEPRLSLLTWSEFADLPEESRVVVVPAGAIEQHGPHLPLGTDSINATAVALEAAAAERVIVAPTVEVGVSTNHMAFPGTVTLRSRTLVDVLVDIVDSLASHGIRRFLLLNGNGGNADAMRFAAGELRAKQPQWVIGYSDIGEMQPDVEIRSGVVYHADETETSHVMYVEPTLVRSEKQLRDLDARFRRHYQRYYAPSAEMHGVISYGLPPTEQLSRTGVMGDATLASAELGRQWHAALVGIVRKAIVDVKTRDVEPASDPQSYPPSEAPS